MTIIIIIIIVVIFIRTRGTIVRQYHTNRQTKPTQKHIQKVQRLIKFMCIKKEKNM